jgi:hypothetical protein
VRVSARLPACPSLSATTQWPPTTTPCPLMCVCACVCVCVCVHACAAAGGVAAAQV